MFGNSSDISLDLGKLHNQIQTLEHSRLDFTTAGEANDFFQKMSEEWKGRAQKPADFCWGTCLGISRGAPEVEHALRMSASFLMTLSRAGFLTMASGRRSPQERREELQGRATIPRATRCLSPFQGNLYSLHCLDFQAEDRLTPRWHVGQTCGKASWESLEGKPQIP